MPLNYLEVSFDFEAFSTEVTYEGRDVTVESHVLFEVGDKFVADLTRLFIDVMRPYVREKVGLGGETAPTNLTGMSFTAESTHIIFSPRH